MSIKTKAKALNRRIVKLQNELVALQETCPHPDESLFRKARCGGENDNEYWFNFHCHDCGKRFQTEQTKEWWYRGKEVPHWQVHP